MPQKVKCNKCQGILYEGPDLKSPEEIIQMNNAECPKCKNKISMVPVNVEVSPAQNAEK